MDPDGVYEKRCSNLSQTISVQDEGFDGGDQSSRGRGDLDDNVQKKIANESEEIVECKKVVEEADKHGTASSLSAQNSENDFDCSGVPSAPPLLPPEEDYEGDIAVPPTSLDNNMSAIPPPTPGSVVIPLTTTTSTDAKPFGLYSANTDLPVASAVPVINDASAVSNNNDTVSTISGAERVRVGSARVLPVPNDSINRPTDRQRNDLEANDISQENHKKIPDNACVITSSMACATFIIFTI